MLLLLSPKINQVNSPRINLKEGGSKKMTSEKAEKIANTNSLARCISMFGYEINVKNR